MTRWLEQMSWKTAWRMLAVGLAVVVAGLAVLAVAVADGGRTNTSQDQRIAAAEADVLEVSTALARANDRLERNGADPVPVPQAAEGAPTVGEGLDGLDGQDGTDGTPGRTGKRGPAGQQGATGTGAAGNDGQDGTDGQPGATGPAGPPGASVTGPEGPTGPAGPQGDQGPAGRDGTDGQPPGSFSFTYLGVTYLCSDPEADGAYACDPT